MQICYTFHKKRKQRNKHEIGVGMRELCKNGRTNNPHRQEMLKKRSICNCNYVIVIGKAKREGFNKKIDFLGNM